MGTATPDVYAQYAEGRDKPMTVSETSALFHEGAATGATDLEVEQARWSQVYDDGAREALPRVRMINWFEQSGIERDLEGAATRWEVTRDPEVRLAHRRALPSWVLQGGEAPPG